MQYAVIKLNSRQYKVKPGDVIEVEKLNYKKAEEVSFADVLLISSDGKVVLGTPTINGALVKATVLGETKGEKVRVSKFKAKVRYRRVTGKRQSLTKIKIEDIVSKESSKKTVKKEVKALAKKQK